MSAKTGRMYHELLLSGDKRNSTPLHSEAGFGLIRSSVAVTLSERIVHGDKNSTCEGTGLMCLDVGAAGTCTYEIRWLPEEAEPGPWAMPV